MMKEVFSRKDAKEDAKQAAWSPAGFAPLREKSAVENQ
jgi:hypothetical protein